MSELLASTESGRVMSLIADSIECGNCSREDSTSEFNKCYLV